MIIGRVMLDHLQTTNMLPEEMVHGGIYEVTNTRTGDFCVGYFDYFKQHNKNAKARVVMKNAIAHYNHLYDGYWNAVLDKVEFESNNLQVCKPEKDEEVAYHTVISAMKAFNQMMDKNERN